MNENWKYEIGTGKTPVVMTLIMLAIFSGLTIWLYQNQNGAFLFTGGFSAILILLVFLTLYRLFFYKIKIGRDEFFYQTNAGNGKTYRYSQIKKAWTSEGRETNGYQNKYCNIDVGSGVVIRFPFYYADEEAVEYLLERIEKWEGREDKLKDKASEEYIIDGKVYGKTRIVISFVLLVVVFLLDILLVKIDSSLLQGNLMADGIKLLFFSSGTILMLAVIVILIIQYVSFKVEIGKKGFFVRTTPWNGIYYEYREIVHCREIEKIVRHRSVGSGSSRGRLSRTYYYYFEVTDVRGKTRKFQFEKPLYEHEINVLKQRIEKKEG